MAKDGTVRGGLRAGAGRKPKDLNAKVLEGREPPDFVPGQLPETADLEGVNMPKVDDWLKETQYDKEEWQAETLAQQVYIWLRERGCETLVTEQQIYSYAVSQARWIQCQRAISLYGFLSNHPVTGKATESPYVKMAEKFGKAAQAAWYMIYQIVREHTVEDYSNSREAAMADLLSD